MGKLILFLLKPGFFDNGDGPYFCPSCAAVEGFLRYAPEVEKQLNVRRVDFPRPRQEIVELVGAANQSCPVLVLDKTDKIPAETGVSDETGRAFISGPTAICEFLGRKFGVSRPHP